MRVHDVDDLNPVFDYANTYHAFINIHNISIVSGCAACARTHVQGDTVPVLPDAVHANDGDTLHAPIAYSLLASEAVNGVLFSTTRCIFVYRLCVVLRSHPGRSSACRASITEYGL
jgi:hypothetical protein